MVYAQPEVVYVSSNRINRGRKRQNEAAYDDQFHDSEGDDVTQPPAQTTPTKKRKQQQKHSCTSTSQDPSTDPSSDSYVNPQIEKLALQLFHTRSKYRSIVQIFVADDSERLNNVLENAWRKAPYTEKNIYRQLAEEQLSKSNAGAPSVTVGQMFGGPLDNMSNGTLFGTSDESTSAMLNGSFTEHHDDVDTSDNMEIMARIVEYQEKPLIKILTRKKRYRKEPYKYKNSYSEWVNEVSPEAFSIIPSSRGTFPNRFLMRDAILEHQEQELLDYVTKYNPGTLEANSAVIDTEIDIVRKSLCMSESDNGKSASRRKPKPNVDTISSDTDASILAFKSLENPVSASVNGAKDGESTSSSQEGFVYVSVFSDPLSCCSPSTPPLPFSSSHTADTATNLREIASPTPVPPAPSRTASEVRTNFTAASTFSEELPLPKKSNTSRSKRGTSIYKSATSPPRPSPPTPPPSSAPQKAPSSTTCQSFYSILALPERTAPPSVSSPKASTPSASISEPCNQSTTKSSSPSRSTPLSSNNTNKRVFKLNGLSADLILDFKAKESKKAAKNRLREEAKAKKGGLTAPLETTPSSEGLNMPDLNDAFKSLTSVMQMDLNVDK
jgi:hypothetical protein